MTSMALAVAQVGIALAIACGQGWLLVAPRKGQRIDATIACMAMLTGIAATIIVSYSLIEFIGSAVFVIPIVLGLTGWLLAALSLVRGSRGPEPRRGIMTPEALTLAVIALIMLVAAVRLEYPLGHDLVFHSFLADKIVETGKLARDWRPWAPIAVNYTQGLHLVAGFLARWTGLTVPRVFEALHFWLGLIGLVPLYLVARRLLPTSWGALTAVLLWTFCCNYGSFFSYFSWGGLPTVLSQTFFLGVILLLLEEPRPPRAPVLAGALLAALVMVSHLGAVIAAWVLGAYLIVALIVREERSRARFLLSSTLWQLVIAAPFLFHYLRKAATIMSTRALRYGDDPPLSRGCRSIRGAPTAADPGARALRGRAFAAKRAESSLPERLDRGARRRSHLLGSDLSVVLARRDRRRVRRVHAGSLPDGRVVSACDSGGGLGRERSHREARTYPRACGRARRDRVRDGLRSVRGSGAPRG